jgi:hypothetical protein
VQQRVGVRLGGSGSHLHGKQAQPDERKRPEGGEQGAERAGRVERSGPWLGRTERHRNPGLEPEREARTRFHKAETLAERSTRHCA